MGAIHPDAIREFMERPRDDNDWVKDLDERALDKELKALGFDYTDPDRSYLLHQKACTLLGIAYPGFAQWIDLGLGKSRLALGLIRYFIKQGEMTGALVLAKSESAVIGWENQIKEWKWDIPYVSLYKSMSSEQKWDALSEFDGGLIIVTYGGLTRMLCDMKKVQKKKGRGAVTINKLMTNPAKVRRMAKLVQCLVPDEATALGNEDSRISQLFYHLRKSSRFCWELAGVPFGRDPTMLWRQLYLIDKGETLGTTLGLFRAAFFKSKQNFWAAKKNKWAGIEYTFDKTKEKQLHRILKHRSITYDESECVDLPKVVHKIEEVRLPQEAKIYYETFLKEIKESHAGFVERKNSFIRMRQISSGYIGVKNSDTGEKAEIQLAANPKLDRLIELIQEIPAGRKFVIWHEFIVSGKLICKALKEIGVDHEWLWGGTKDARKLQDRFDHDPACRGLVANHKVAAYSLNLQRGNYSFVFEAPVSPIDDRQMRKRLARQGQTRTVFEYDLITRGTVDGRILEFHREGASLFKALIRDPKVLHR